MNVCRECGADCTHKKHCKACGAPVVYVPPTKPEKEAPIKARIRAALIEAGCIVWVHDIDYRLGKTGLGKGTSDLICIVPPLGRFLAVEVKRPGYSPSDVRPDQRCFIAVVRKFNGIAGIAVDVPSALALVAEARQQCPFDASRAAP